MKRIVMKKYILVLIIVGSNLIYFPLMAGQVRQLKWEDLVPAHLLADDPLAKLTQEQQDLVIWVINTLDSLPKRGPETEEYYKEIDKAMPALREADIDIVELLSKRKKYI